MQNRRILSLWFPRFGAERVLRADRGLTEAPLAVAANIGNAQVLVSLSVTASEAGLTPGQPLRDAQAMCPELVTRLQNPVAEALFLKNLRRWAGKFSPWVAEEPPEGLMVDLTGCAHLFGGEPGLLAEVEADCARLGLTVRAGIADTPGAAWALARYAGRASGAAARSGDDIDQEARATRSRAARRRHWEKGGPAPQVAPLAASAARIAPVGGVRAAIGPLPVAALRLDDSAVADLVRLGLRRIEDLSGQPRAALARRFGAMLVRRLDQAMGTEPEPITPAKPPDHFAVRLTLPEPIGLEDDMLAAVDRLLPRLTDALEDAPLVTPRQGPLAYVIFTSGSQGRPKGVMLPHTALAYSTAVRDEVYGAGPAAYLVLSSLGFDSAVPGLFWPLATGGTVVLALGQTVDTHWHGL